MQLEFTPLEYNYLARVSSKLLLARKKLTDKEMSKGTNAVVKELATKFSLNVQPANVHQVPLKRTHIRFLQEALSKSLQVIDERILPEYNSRPNKAELGEYIQRMEETKVMLTSMLTKINGAI